MKHATRILCAGALLALGSAAEASVYLGAGVYSSSLDAATGTALGAVDGNDVTPSLFLGFRPIELVGVEVGYYDFGQISGGAGATAYAAEGRAYTVSGLFSIELGPAAVFLKGGFAHSTFEQTVTAVQTEDTSGDIFGGVGASVDVWDKVYVYAEHVMFKGDRADAALTGVGIRYSL